MADEKFLTAEEVADRYRGEASAGALENWRAWPALRTLKFDHAKKCD